MSYCRQLRRFFCGSFFTSCMEDKPDTSNLVTIENIADIDVMLGVHTNVDIFIENDRIHTVALNQVSHYEIQSRKERCLLLGTGNI